MSSRGTKLKRQTTLCMVTRGKIAPKAITFFFSFSDSLNVVIIIWCYFAGHTGSTIRKTGAWQHGWAVSGSARFINVNYRWASFKYFLIFEFDRKLEAFLHLKYKHNINVTGIFPVGNIWYNIWCSGDDYYIINYGEAQVVT